MANLQAEGGFSPLNAQDEYGYPGEGNPEYIAKYNIRDGVGWGIAQWTYYSRKQGLLDMANSRNTSVGDMDTQLTFLKLEFETLVPNTMKMIRNSSDINEITKLFMENFENPGDNTLGKRQGFARDIYNELKNR